MQYGPNDVSAPEAGPSEVADAPEVFAAEQAICAALRVFGKPSAMSGSELVSILTRASTGTALSAEAAEQIRRKFDRGDGLLDADALARGLAASATIALDLHPLGPIRAHVPPGTSCACTSTEAVITFAGYVAVVRKAEAVTRYDVADAIEDHQVETEDFESANAHQLPCGGWLFTASNDSFNRFHVSARRRLGARVGTDYTVQAVVHTLAQQEKAVAFCREGLEWVESSETCARV